MRTIDIAERRRRLIARHHLAGSAGTAAGCAGDLVGLHSSDPATVFLAAWARVDGFIPGDLEQALYDDREVVRMLGMRRTMFVVPRDFAAVMDAACTRSYAASERRRFVKMLETQGITDNGTKFVERIMEATLAALWEAGSATASELREIVPELKRKLTFGEGKKWGGSVGLSTRVMFLLATEGLILRGRPKGTWISSQYRWAPTELWLGSPLQEIDKQQAQTDLVRRWLRTFGPGTMSDIKWWTGWTVRETRAALAATDAEEVDLAGAVGYVLADDLEPPPEGPSPVTLLPALDPTVMGWKDRTWYLGDHASQLFDRNGNAGPTVWCRGRIVGGWGQRADGEVVVELLEDVGTTNRRALERTAAELATWLGAIRITPRFRTPIDKRLTAS